MHIVHYTKVVYNKKSHHLNLKIVRHYNLAYTPFSQARQGSTRNRGRVCSSQARAVGTTTVCMAMAIWVFAII